MGKLLRENGQNRIEKDKQRLFSELQRCVSEEKSGTVWREKIPGERKRKY